MKSVTCGRMLPDLLEEICAHTNCQYVSDLHSISNCFQIYEAAEGLKRFPYSLMEWETAVNYIMNSNQEFETVDLALAQLEQYCRNKE